MADGTLIHEIDKWSNLVGRFILAFCEIELATYKLWEVHFPEKDMPLNFKTRCDKIIGRLKALGATGINGENPIDLIISARGLADKRNTIAHNPVQTQVFQSRATDDYHIELAITSEENEHYLTEHDLESLHEQTAKLGKELFIYLSDSVWAKNV